MRTLSLRRRAIVFGILLATGRFSAGQTRVDLRTQSKSADLSSVGTTKTFQVGTSLPTNCPVGASFLETGQASSTLFVCTSSGVWSQVMIGVPGGQSALSGTRLSSGATDTLSASDIGVNVIYTNAGSVTVTLPQAGNGSGLVSSWTAFVFNATGGGNVTIAPAASTIDGATSLVVPPLQGVSIWSDGTNYHTNGTLLKPGTGVILSNRQLNADTSVMLSISDYQTGTPLGCFSNSGSSTAYACNTPTVFGAYANGMRVNWQPDVACGASATLSVNGLASVAIKEAGGRGTAAGDCDTAGKNVTLAYNSVLGGGPYWEIVGGGAIGSGSGSGAGLPGTAVQTNQSNKYTSGTQDFTSAQHTMPVVTGLVAALPASCQVGEEYFASDATPGQNLYFCTAAGTWTHQSGSATLPGTAVQTNQGNRFTTGTQDFSSAQHTLPVVTGLAAGLQGSCQVGEQYFATDATPGQNLYFCTAAGTWTQGSGSGGGGGGTSVTAVPPYLQIGASYYLPYAFKVGLPPTAGWTPINFTGSTFATSGLGGAIAMTSASYSNAAGSAAGQYRAMGATTTLIAAVSSQQSLTAQTAACGIGVLQSSTGKSYAVQNVFNAVSNVMEEDSYYNGLGAGAFFTGQQALGGAPLSFLRLQITGGNVVGSVSPNGLNWTVLVSRAIGSYGIASSFDQWVFTGIGQASYPTTCTLLSWSVQ